MCAQVCADLLCTCVRKCVCVPTCLCCTNARRHVCTRVCRLACVAQELADRCAHVFADLLRACVAQVCADFALRMCAQVCADMRFDASWRLVQATSTVAAAAARRLYLRRGARWLGKQCRTQPRPCTTSKLACSRRRATNMHHVRPTIPQLSVPCLTRSPDYVQQSSLTAEPPPAT